MVPREIFTDAVLHKLEYGVPIKACDSATGTKLQYTFSACSGGLLSVDLPGHHVAVGVDSHQINLVATALIDGFRKG